MDNPIADALWQLHTNGRITVKHCVRIINQSQLASKTDRIKSKYRKNDVLLVTFNNRKYSSNRSFGQPLRDLIYHLIDDVIDKKTVTYGRILFQKKLIFEAQKDLESLEDELSKLNLPYDQTEQ